MALREQVARDIRQDLAKIWNMSVFAVASVSSNSDPLSHFRAELWWRGLTTRPSETPRVTRQKC